MYYTLATCLRRDVLHLSAALTAAAATNVLLGPAAASAAVDSAPVSRETAISNTLSRVPAYLVTNEFGDPYLTESDENGRRSGSVFLGPNDAVPLLEEVRRFDTKATLVVVPLSTVYQEVAKNSADAAAARQLVAQPRESTSRDLRLFSLRPLSDEKVNLDAISMLPGASMQPGVTLYYEPSLLLGADEASRLRPYFFRLSDLNRVWRAGGGDDRNSGRISPSLKVVTLERLMQQAQNGELSNPPMLMPPGETADLTYR